MKLKNSFLVVIIFAISSCSASKVITPEKINEIASKPVNEWSYEDCDAMISKYTSYNVKGFEEKFVNVTYNGEIIFIKAVPLIESVIQAKVRKEAIIRRYNNEEYISRLKDDLELYTNKTVNLDTGEIIFNHGYNKYMLDKLSFEVEFENISEPREPIEIEYAYKGFFIENKIGDFGRVADISGYYVDDYLVIIDRLKAVITFSVFDDNGERIFGKDKPDNEYRLVFNGFHADPVIINWSGETK